MKKFCFILFCLFVYLFNTNGQTYSDYNRRGDQAMEAKDFQLAKTFYSEGLTNCNDYYSIKKLTEIWRSQPQMQQSMNVIISGCRKCLIQLTKNEEAYTASAAMALLAEYYHDGIGIEKDSFKADSLKKEAATILTGLSLTPENGTSKIDSVPQIIVPTQNIDTIPPLKFSDKYKIFVAYTFSPTMPVGINAGIFNKLGVMLGFKSSIQKRPKYEYECNSSTIFNLNSNYSYEFTSKEKWHSMMFTAQVLLPVITKKLFISAGGGYGKRELYNNAELYDKETGAWVSNIECYNSQGSYKGAVAEAGILYKHKHLIIISGINSVSFKDLDGYVGIGYSF